MDKVPKRESELTEAFCQIINSGTAPWDIKDYAFEFNHRIAITDVIAIDNSETVYAFEMKLHKWKKAMNQAYRNTFFANKSYVVMPKKTALSAIKGEEYFNDAKIGLCAIDNGKIEILIEAKTQKPMYSWLRKNAMEVIQQTNSG